MATYSSGQIVGPSPGGLFEVNGTDHTNRIKKLDFYQHNREVDTKSPQFIQAWQLYNVEVYSVKSFFSVLLLQIVDLHLTIGSKILASSFRPVRRKRES